MQANCHFLYNREGGAGFIIDPGGDAEEIIDMVNAAEVVLKAILITHGHDDHLGGTAEVKKATGAKVFGTEEAAAVLAAPEDHMLFPGMPSFPKTEIDHIIRGDEDLNIAGAKVQAIATPGHTPGSLTYFANGSLFCGDLLFRGSVGRTDLPGGSFEELIESVQKLISLYPSGTVVYPGHGSSTTLKFEQESNPFLTNLGR